jgi:hypothetical protein
MLDPDLVKRAADRYLSGEIIKDIAYSVGVPEPTLRAAIKRLGVSRPHLGHGPKRKLSSEQEQGIVDKYRNGKSANAISTETGIARMTVQRTLNRLGVAKNPDFEKSDPLTEEEKDLVVDECAHGMTIKAVSNILNVSAQTVQRTLRERGVSLRIGRPRSCTVDENVFDIITPVSARWMGFLFADGCLPRDTSGQQAISMNIGAKDRAHVEKFRAFLGSNHAITEIRNKERVIDGRTTPASSAVFYKVRSNRLVDALVVRGMLKEKGPERTPAVELENVPAFWAGVVDGDGWLGTTENKGCLYPYVGLCGHMPLLEKFKLFLSRRSIIDLTIIPTASGIWRVQTTGSAALAVVKLLYSEESSAAGLLRKIVRARQIINGERVPLYEEGPVVADLKAI